MSAPHPLHLMRSVASAKSVHRERLLGLMSSQAAWLTRSKAKQPVREATSALLHSRCSRASLHHVHNIHYAWTHTHVPQTGSFETQTCCNADATQTCCSADDTLNVLQCRQELPTESRITAGGARLGLEAFLSPAPRGPMCEDRVS